MKTIAERGFVSKADCRTIELAFDLAIEACLLLLNGEYGLSKKDTAEVRRIARKRILAFIKLRKEFDYEDTPHAQKRRKKR